MPSSGPSSELNAGPVMVAQQMTSSTRKGFMPRVAKRDGRAPAGASRAVGDAKDAVDQDGLSIMGLQVTPRS